MRQRDPAVQPAPGRDEAAHVLEVRRRERRAVASRASDERLVDWWAGLPAA
jgi:hypothetical protein